MTAAAFMMPHPPLAVPEVGGGREKEIQKTLDSFREAARRIGAIEPETIVLVSPHQVMYRDYFHISPGTGAQGDFGQFGAQQVKMQVRYDVPFRDMLCGLAGAEDLPAGVLGERSRELDHGTMVPLYFIHQFWKDYRLVRVGLSGLSLARHYELGQCIRKTAEKLGRKTVLVASGDLSHRLKEDGPYGCRKEGPEYDGRIMDVMGRGAFGELFDFTEEFCQKAGECGHRSFVIMAGALDRTGVEAECLSYEGPFGVGYGICCYRAVGEDPGRDFGAQFRIRAEEEMTRRREQEDAYIRLARKTIETYVRTGKTEGVPRNLPREMYGQRAGVFVSIKKDGQLRGCIGTIQPVQDSIAEEIVENAVSASSRDPRFSPIAPEELDRLVVSVDILGAPEKIASPEELDVKRYGVIVTKGRKRGLLLPCLEGVDTVEEQIAIAKEKAGIKEWEEAGLERFEVVRHEVRNL